MDCSRRGRGTVVSLGLVVALVTGCTAGESGGAAGTATAPPPGSAPATSSSAPVEERIAREIFDRVNDEREERGLEPLAWDATLAGVAADWSEEMAREGRLEHQDIGAVLEREDLSGFRGVGENIFTASSPVPAGVIHVGWMESDDHRVNVLNPGWNRIGIGVHCADDGAVWATQEFGRTVDADVPAVATEVPPREPIARAAEDGPRCA